MYKLILIMSVLLVLALGMIDCTRKIPGIPPLPHPPFAPYRPISPYQKSLLGRMHSAGVQVVKQENLLVLIIPIDHFFQLQTTNVKPNKIYAVKKLARFVRSYTNAYAHPIINVYGLTNKTLPKKTRQELALRYAEVIGSYLWSMGVSREQLHIRGFGAVKNGLNRRVEIQIKFQ